MRSTILEEIKSTLPKINYYFTIIIPQIKSGQIKIWLSNRKTI